MNNTTPLVSIVMPSYNSERFIKEAIDSVINQTYTNWELIIVDGHSTDNTLQIIKEYTDYDSRISVVFDNGKGIGDAANVGCNKSNGVYIARLDSDDLSLPDRLEKEIEYLEKHPEVLLVSCTAEYIDENGNVLGYGMPYTADSIIKKTPSVIVHSGVVMRKEAYLKVGGYPPIKGAEDLFLWYRISNIGKIHIIGYPLIKYRITEGSLSNNKTDFFRENVCGLWSIMSKKPNLNSGDFEYLNRFIMDNTLDHPNIMDEFLKKSEQNALRVLKTILPLKTSLSFMLFLKNIYGKYFKSK